MYIVLICAKLLIKRCVLAFIYNVQISLKELDNHEKASVCHHKHFAPI